MNGRRLHREFLDLAAARLDEPLAPADEVRLEAHLATCDACRERVTGYEADRAALRGLREMAPPRDLWARTSAALDREQTRAARSARSGGGQVAGGGPAGRRTVHGAFAAALAMLVIVALVGSGFLPGFPGPLGGPNGAQATPFDVEPQLLAYFSTRDGEVGVYMGRIDRVCPEAAAENCPAIETDVRKVASFASDFVPQRLAVAPDGRSAAVVGTSASGGAVYTLHFPDLATETPAPTVTASVRPTGDLPPTGSSEPSPDGAPTPLIPGSPGPGGSVEPEAIIDHVIVVGETPAYSADGSMLAFSAMPADGSSGPDIYLWRVGSDAAVPVTTDHGSIFASWAGGAIVGSRAVVTADAPPETATPSSFLLDPATLEERALVLPAWRPIVDPTGRFVIYWDGALQANADGLTWREARGGLYLAAWQLFDPAAAGPEPGPTQAPTDRPDQGSGPTTAPTGGSLPTAAPAETGESTDGAVATSEPSVAVSTEPPIEPAPKPPAEPTGRATEPPAPFEPGEPQKLEPQRDYLADPIASWEVRWSPDGEWFGVWIGDRKAGEPPSPGQERGALTVGAVDRETGRFDRERTQLDRAPAARGFALGDHRIAWVTLPEGGGTTEVRLLVWTDDGRNRGIIRTTPRDGSDTLPAL